MKTLAVISMILLNAISFTSKSINHVSFGVEVIIDQKFSPKELNVTLSKGEIKTGNTITLEKHQDYLYAMKDKYTITGNTSNTATIQAFFMDEKISLDDAFGLMNNYNSFDETSLSYTKAIPNDFYYAIEILTKEDQTLQDYIKTCPELELQISQKQENIFIMGKITSHAKAIETQNKLQSAGLKNCVIVAFEGNKQVPVYIVGRR